MNFSNRKAQRILSSAVLAVLVSCGDSVAPDLGPAEVQVSSESTSRDSDDAKAQWFADLMAQRPPTAGEYGPYEIQLGDATFAYLQQVATPAESMPLIPPGTGGIVYTYSLFVEATQAVELFSLFVPPTAQGVRRPLLTAFHGFGSSHRDIDVRTSFFEEAALRDWFMVAPLQRNTSDPQGSNFDINYGSAQSQLHVEAVIRFVIDSYSIDLDRLYAVGFSMGGGSALSYAARHRDRGAGAFAAVVNHTGTVSLADEYRAQAPGGTVREIMETIFGGSPNETAFQWQRSSLVELKASGALDDNGRSMARNLVGVPIQTWFNSEDALTHLVNQARRLDEFFMSVPGASHELIEVVGPIAGCGNMQHCWDTLDEAVACDWLEQQSLDRRPLRGTLLVDRPGDWGYFEVEQVDLGKFSSVTFEVDPTSNALILSAPENIGALRTDLGALGFDPSSSIKLDLQGFDSTQGALTVENVQLPPTSIFRDGQAVLEDCGSSAPTWCYDSSLQTLTVQETFPATTRWRIDF